MDLVAVRDQSSKSLFSQSWYRVADLVPRLRSHARFTRHSYRGRDWYVLQDQSTGRFHRFSSEAYLIIGMMDGARSLSEIWKAACERLADDMPTQDEVVNLLAYLHQADILQSDIPPDIRDLYERSKKEKQGRWLAKLKSPAAMNFPLLDPDRFLEKTMPVVKYAFSWAGLLTWAVVVGFALALAGMHWRELTTGMADRVLSLQNVFLLGLIYPVTRVFHEFAHAYAVKRWGGEVHEMGIMLIAFLPMPYVDASSSSGFYQKARRMAVGAAGIMMDLFIAALAMIAWANMGPGLVRAVAYNVILIGGVSTLLLNGNPLLRFDSYYVLSDYLEIPNLADRGNKYIGYLLQRYVLGIKEAVSPAQEEGERPWLAVYAVASFIYRIVISISIVLFIAGQFFFIGVVLAAWSAVAIIIYPLVKTFRYVFQNLRKNLGRIALAGGGALAVITAAVLIVPLPSFTIVEGIVWVPEEAQIFAGTEGFVTRVLAVPGSLVRKGEPLVHCEAPDLRAEINVLQAGVREVEARYRASFVKNVAEAQVIADEMATVRARLARAEERFGEMVVRSPADGIFLLPRAEDLPGSFIRRGIPLGYVVDFSRMKARVVVNQADVNHIRNRTRAVKVRLAESVRDVYPAAVEREVPGASKDLPSLALSLEGGGSVALDPKGQPKEEGREAKMPQAFEKLFQFDISLAAVQASGVGERVFVRFEHDPEPVGYRWYRAVRRMLLKRFDV